MHPPAFFDFRDRRDVYFTFLDAQGDVPITPLQEYFPIGVKTLSRYLRMISVGGGIDSVSLAFARPFGSSDQPPDLFDEFYGSTTSLWQRSRPGPILWVYELD